MLVEVALVGLLAKQMPCSVPKSFGGWDSSCTLLRAKQVIAQGALVLLVLFKESQKNPQQKLEG